MLTTFPSKSPTKPDYLAELVSFHCFQTVFSTFQSSNWQNQSCRTRVGDLRLESTRVGNFATWGLTWDLSFWTWDLTCDLEIGTWTWLETCSQWLRSQVQVARKTKSQYFNKIQFFNIFFNTLIFFSAFQRCVIDYSLKKFNLFMRFDLNCLFGLGTWDLTYNTIQYNKIVHAPKSQSNDES